MRQHVAPEIRRGGIAVKQHDGVTLSDLHVRHLAAEDPPPLLLVWKCRRDHIRFSFSSRLSSACPHNLTKLYSRVVRVWLQAFGLFRRESDARALRSGQ